MVLSNYAIRINSSRALRCSSLSDLRIRGVVVRWELDRTKKFPTGMAAYEFEQNILEKLRLEGRWIGGEFVIVNIAQLDELVFRT